MIEHLLFNVLIAQDGAGAPAEAPAEDPGLIASVLDIFNSGGIMMWVILAVSIAGTLIFLGRGFNLYVSRRLSVRSFVSTVTGHIEQKRFRQALDSCQVGSKHPLVATVKAGLIRANRPEKEIERAMEREMLEVLPGLNRGIQFVALLANTATLLGLLGTIAGLMAAFDAVSNASAADRATELANGIATAMYTTAWGIAVAVPLLFFHHFLSRRTEDITLQVEAGATAVLVALRGSASNDQAK